MSYFDFIASYHEGRKAAAVMKANIPYPKQTIAERNELLRTSRYWELWTGSRFERVENPICEMDRVEYMRSCWARPGESQLPEIKNRLVRSNPVTGDYEVMHGAV